MKTKTYMVIALILAFCTSCATMKVNYHEKHVSDFQNITLISTMIGKIRQPLLPLVDAAAFNEKTNSIADQIMDLQKQSINSYREMTAACLKKYFNCNVYYGESLHSLPEFNDLKSNLHFPGSLRINSNNYPVILTADEDINPFKFENGNVLSYFMPSNSPAYRPVIMEIARRTNSDLVALSYSTLSVVGANMFGINGTLRLDTYLYVFEKDGDLIADAHSWSKPTVISGKESGDYKAQLGNLSMLIDPLTNKVASPLK